MKTRIRAFALMISAFALASIAFTAAAQSPPPSSPPREERPNIDPRTGRTPLHAPNDPWRYQDDRLFPETRRWRSREAPPPPPPPPPRWRDDWNWRYDRDIPSLRRAPVGPGTDFVPLDPRFRYRDPAFRREIERWPVDPRYPQWDSRRYGWPTSPGSGPLDANLDAGLYRPYGPNPALISNEGVNRAGRANARDRIPNEPAAHANARIDPNRLYHIRGWIIDTRTVSLNAANEPQTIAWLETRERAVVPVLLGSSGRLDRLNLTRGDRVTVMGTAGSIDGDQAMIAREIECDGVFTVVTPPDPHR